MILEETINKSYLNKNDNKKFWDYAIIEGVYIDEQKSANNKVHIGILYCIPESEICENFEIIVVVKENRSIKELETAAIH